MAIRRTLLVDLDDTLFDHSGATRDALAELRNIMPAFRAWTLDQFDDRHRVVLEAIHLQVLAGEWSIETARVERFRQLLVSAGAHDHAGDIDELDRISWAYRAAYERGWRLVEGAALLLAAARADDWRIVVVTNNAVKEQQLKLERGGLVPLVDVMVTSEEFGSMKPDPRIIHHAIERVNGLAAASVMFGDSLSTDIAAARAAGVGAVWFNRFGGTSPDRALVEVTSLVPTGNVLEKLAQGAVCERV